MMYYINGFMLLLLIPQLFLEEDMLKVTGRAIILYPRYLFNLLMLTICSTMAQYFVLRLIRQYGAVTFVLSCLMRSMITIIVAKYLRVGYWEWFEIGEFLTIVILILLILNRRKPWEKVNKVPLALKIDLMPLKSY